MKTPKKLKKLTFVSVINDVPLIKELYEDFIKKGFTSEQAYGLTITIIKQVLK